MHLLSTILAPRRRVLTVLALLGALILTGLTLATGGSAASGGPCTPPVANPIVCENSLPGDPPSDWEVTGAGDSSIQGFATQIGVNVGQTENFKINTPSTNYHIDILRLGYYGGDGARLIASNIKPSVTLPQTQPSCLTDSSTGEIDCGNWGVSASWTVPSTAVSGLYIAHLVRDDSKDPGGDSQILFVVRNDSSHSDILLQTSDETWEAYNDYGGNSLYTCTVACPPGNPLAYKAAYAVSYNRPFDGALTTDNGASDPFYAEYQMIRWMEENGYDVSYTNESNVDSNGSLLLNHKVFISSGHDEYWSAGQRANVQAALKAGVNLAFFSGNEVFWKTRWGNSIDGSNTPYRTVVTYKETHFNAPTDPQDPPTWTGAWADPRFSPPADGGQPANALTGQQFIVNGGSSDISVPYQYSKLRFWRNTAVSQLTPGQSLTLAPGNQMLGYEWDQDEDNGFRPTGLFDMSSTTVSGVQAFTDYGSLLNDKATATHHLTLYRAPSGALVFGAGTVQWSWGLDDTNAWDEPGAPFGSKPDPTVEQATVNLFADMGAQPASLISGLVPATQGTNTTPPTSTITSPTAGATLQDNSAVTVTGTATDPGGGVIAEVDVSTDGGATWHPATIGNDAQTVNWSYNWVDRSSPTTTIMSRAIDDSGNIEKPSAGVQVNVNCPCSLWGSGVTPTTVDSGDSGSVELGMKFTSDAFGTISGVRFYKSAANTGTHVGSLYTANGTLLASATFANETPSGWQQVSFSQPVPINPNTTYVIAYFAPSGHYSDDQYYFDNPPPTGGNALNSPPLHAVPTTATTTNGLYTYSTSSTFPTNVNSGGDNYWVDPVFSPASAPGQVTGVTATGGVGAATVNWNAPATGGAPTTYTITPYIGSAAQQTTTVTGSPPATSATVTGLTGGTSYTFTVQASNPLGNGAVSGQSNAVTPTAPTAPTAPTGVSASGASSQALVSWTAPANNGGSSITGYTVTPFIGSNAQTPVQVGGSASQATVTGLNNGTSYTFTVTATNAIGTSPASTASNSATPQDTIFDFSAPAASAVDSGDGSGVNLGVKFTASQAGTVSGIRFYKAAANTGTHIGSLYTASGTLLATATFTNETASGWQQVNFSQPVAISANTTYVAAYFAPLGHYSDSAAAFASSGVSNPPLQAVANSSSANGVYAYGNSANFPSSSFNSTNYWVDVDFQPTSPPGQVTGVTATGGQASATVNWNAPATGGAPTTYTITPYIGSAAQQTTTVTGSPPATSATVTGLTGGTSYTFTVQASSSAGNGPVSSQSNAVTPTSASPPSAPTNVSAAGASSQALVTWSAPSNNGGSPITGYTVTPFIGSNAQTPVQVGGSASQATVTGLNNGTSYTFTVTATNAIGTSPASTASNSATPQDTIFDFSAPTGSAVDSGDTTGVNLGVKFTSDTFGTVTGIRFYKAAANTGTHIGSLYTASGTLLATATFTNETASGWQQVNFSQPVAINPNTTYVAAYFAPSGHYSDTASAFATAGVNNAPLHALPNATSADGVYAYGRSATFPSSAYQSTNYWVDVDFSPVSAAPGQVTGVTATGGSGSATVSWSAPSSGGPPTTYTITPYIGTTAQPTTTVTGSPPATTGTVNGLTAGTTYTFTVTASNPQGSGPASAQSNPVGTASAPGAPTSVTASGASSQALVSWTAPANNGGSSITGYTVTPFIGSSAQTPVQVGGSANSASITGLTNGTSYTFTVTATNAIGTSPASTASNAAVPEDTIFDFATPATIDSGDNSSVELGVKFTSDQAGMVTGVRFYKAANNTGTHIGSLWTSTGTLLASATFTNETASGWQMVNFSQPVAISANTTYVAAYLAPQGHYSVTGAAFATGGVDNPPLHAIPNSTSVNGVYAYSRTSTFPASSYNSSNYWVDPMFASGS